MKDIFYFSDKIKQLSTTSKYTRWYCNIVERAALRTGSDRPSLGEKHHVVPRSVDAADTTEIGNIVLLSYREHFIAHMLLSKCFTSGQHRKKMAQAVSQMCVGVNRKTHQPSNPYASRRFDQIRTKLYNAGIYHNTVNTAWVTKGKKSLRVSKTDLSQYTIDGWELGRARFKRVSQIYVHKDGVLKRILPKAKAEYVLDGWSTGLPHTSKIVVTNGAHNIRVEPDQVPDGYRPGSCQTTALGRKWVTNGSTDVYLKSGENCPNGWWLGRSNAHLRAPKQTTNTGKIRITNNVVQKYWDAAEPIPDGWWRGSLPRAGGWTWKKNSTTRNL